MAGAADADSEESDLLHAYLPEELVVRCLSFAPALALARMECTSAKFEPLVWEAAELRFERYEVDNTINCAWWAMADSGDETSLKTLHFIDQLVTRPRRSIAAGAHCTFAVRSDGSAFGWGGALFGPGGDMVEMGIRYGKKRTAFWLDHLGIGLKCGGYISTPTPMKGLGGEIVAEVSCGDCHTLILTEGGHAYSVGTGDSGRLGHGEPEKMVHAPYLGSTNNNSLDLVRPRLIDHAEFIVTSELTGRLSYCLGELCGVVQVSAGQHHSLVLTNEGRVLGFGKGCGHGHGFGDEYRPIQLCSQYVGEAEEGNKWQAVVLPTARVVQMSAGSGHSLFVTVDGQLHGCGKHSMLGLGKAKQRDEEVAQPRRIPMPEDDPLVYHASAGWSHNLVISTTGKLYAFGTGKYSFGMPMWNGRHGTPFNDKYDFDQQPDPLTPTRVPLGTCRVRDAWAGREHSVICTENGQVFTFGTGSRGRLGTGKDAMKEHVWKPERIQGMEGATMVTAGETHTLVQLASGVVMAFGSNDCGELGLGDAPEGDDIFDDGLFDVEPYDDPPVQTLCRATPVRVTIPSGRHCVVPNDNEGDDDKRTVKQANLEAEKQLFGDD